ncbi:MAG: SigE family RNA polymerase sigma factor [Kineosporiaceae bacterium]|nr:SigE family RNA polymerase sigma factor [Kineosporiaceae bacterium]
MTATDDGLTVWRPGAPPTPFERYVEARGDALHRTAYLLTHDHTLAEDLVQTSLAKAWGSWQRISTSPDAYVRSIMMNTFCSWWQRRWRGELPTGELPEPRAAGGIGADPQDDAAVRLALLAALRSLPRRQRAVIVLRFFDDQTEAETARVLGVSVGTVKSQTAKALTKLRVDPALAWAPAAVDLEGGSR